jgi:hypothetical protein
MARWIKGKSGNPTSRPKRGGAIADLARQQIAKHKLVEILGRIGGGQGEYSGVEVDQQLGSIQLLLSYGYGPEFSSRRLALLPSALFVERLLRCQMGVLNWKRVLPSRSRTECLFPETLFLARAAVTRTRRFPFQSLSSSSFCLIPSCIVVSQWFVHLTRHPQPMK